MKSKNEPDIELSKMELDRMVNSDAPNDRQNFITDDVSLITDNSLYRKNMPLQRIYQTANPGIILVMQGNADYNVNNLPYKLGKGDLFIVPIGTIFQVRFRSDDFMLKVIDYHLNQDNKMNYYALWLKRHHLTESDFFRVNLYYELIHECYSSHMEMRESVVYIVLALLHDIIVSAVVRLNDVKIITGMQFFPLCFDCITAIVLIKNGTIDHHCDLQHIVCKRRNRYHAQAQNQSKHHGEKLFHNNSPLYEDINRM